MSSASSPQPAEHFRGRKKYAFEREIQRTQPDQNCRHSSKIHQNVNVLCPEHCRCKETAQKIATPALSTFDNFEPIGRNVTTIRDGVEGTARQFSAKEKRCTNCKGPPRKRQNFNNAESCPHDCFKL